MFVDSRAAPFCSHVEHFARPGAFSAGTLGLFAPNAEAFFALSEHFARPKELRIRISPGRTRSFGGERFTSLTLIPKHGQSRAFRPTESPVRVDPYEHFARPFTDLRSDPGPGAGKCPLSPFSVNLCQFTTRQW